MIARDRDNGRDPPVRSEAFELGQLVVTPGTRESIPPSEVLRALRRHARGDWGSVTPDDHGLNDYNVEHGGRLFSEYHSEAGVKFWTITEADRSVTTVLLPEEY